MAPRVSHSAMVVYGCARREGAREREKRIRSDEDEGKKEEENESANGRKEDVSSTRLYCAPDRLTNERKSIKAWREQKRDRSQEKLLQVLGS